MEKRQAHEYINDVLKSRFDQEQFDLFMRNLLNEFEPRSNSYSGNLIPEAFRDHISHYKRIGKYTDPEGEPLDILIVQTRSVKKLERTRTALRNFVVRHLKTFDKQYALVAFYSKEDDGVDWRLSLVKIDYESQRNEEGKIKIKEDLVPAKRFSFLVGENEGAYTAQKQLLPLLTNDHANPLIVAEKDGDGSIEGAFSIEKVTNEFYGQYKELYLKLSENVSLVEALEKEGLYPIRFVKKLLGQIVFLYFLQKKGWLGVPKDSKMGKGSKRFLQDRFELIEENSQNYFNDFLRYLFYDALAREHNDDGTKYYFRQLDCKIPFLNGGLFEAEYDWESANIELPNSFFRNNEKNKAGDKGTGILDVFDRYNFTIKEDEPLEKEVAVDPEMLGKVFENMLEITERKSKGAFYTPREIVHYMCQESLIHYLDNAVNEYTENYQAIDTDQTNMFGSSTNKNGNLKIELENKGEIRVPKTDIEQFIRHGHLLLEHEEDYFKTQQRIKKGEIKSTSKTTILSKNIKIHSKVIDNALADIKICDPAIGSGAFPVGLLHEIVTARSVLNSFLQNDEHTPYYLKRHAIQESIYGVDIDASAIDIARLRLWLSMIVDEDDYNTIEALPNLDYKIVCGNSLIGLPAQGTSRYPQLSDELENIKAEFFNETDDKRKIELRNQINEQINNVLKAAEDFEGYEIDFDFTLFFSEVWHYKGGFDVVIGNPPYVVDKTFKEWQKDYFKRNYKSALYQINLYMLFMEKAFKLSHDLGFSSYIVPNTWLVNKLVAPFRKHLIENFNILSVVDLTNEDVFDATVLPVIYTALRGKPINNIAIIEGENYLFSKKGTLSSRNITNQPNYLINYQISDEDWEVINHIEEETISLESVAKSSFGVKFYQKGKGKPKQNAAIVKNHSFTHNDRVDNTCKIILEGRNIERYKVIPGKKFIQYGIWLAEPRDEQMFEGERILVRRIVDSSGLVAANVTGNYCNNSLLHVVKPFDLSPKSLTCLLNSEVIGYYFIKKYARKEKTFPEIRIHELNSLPIKQDYNENVFELIHDFIEFTINSPNVLISVFFQQLANALIFELYFLTEFKSANKQILPLLGNLKPITDEMSDEEKLAIIQSEFERLYDPNHPVRNNLETLDSIEEVRIIKDALK